MIHIIFHWHLIDCAIIYLLMINNLFQFDNTYLKLPRLFYSLQPATPVAHPQFAEINTELIADFGIDMNKAESSQDLLQLLSGNKEPSTKHFSQAYCGHQFGHFNRLGDGRAHLLGEALNKHGSRFDIQLKGSGPTPYSRQGDGRAALGPMLREYLMGEFFNAVGIPTTRALAVVTTGEPVYREKPYAGAILSRVAKSHIRVGTFQYAAAYGQTQDVQALADYSIARHYPEALNHENRYLYFFEQVQSQQAQLIADWMSMGFIHGVMNTDNMTISGETIDFGPCAFLDHYDLNAVFSSIDHSGRYAYGQQPSIAHWNLYRFAETLLPLFSSETEKSIQLAQSALEKFPQLFESYLQKNQHQKLGLDQQTEQSRMLVQKLLKLFSDHKTDMTEFYYQLSELNAPAPMMDWQDEWKKNVELQNISISEAQTKIKKNNPIYIPRNFIVDSAIKQYTENNNSDMFRKLLTQLRNPYRHDSEPIIQELFLNKPAPDFKTFCGT